MDRLNLPWLAGSTSLLDAVEAMRKHRTSGFVAETSAGPHVIDLDSLLVSLRTGKAFTVEALTPRFRTIAVDDGMGIVPANPQVEDKMDQAGATFAVILGTQFVLPRHEVYGIIVESLPPLYRCEDNEAHIWRTEQLSQPGDHCPDDGADTSLI